MKGLQQTEISDAAKSNLLRSGIIRSTAPSSVDALNEVLFNE